MRRPCIDPEKVCVGGIDATADALARMHAGDLDVTVFQDAKGQGRGAVEAAVKLANKEKQDQMVLIPYELVTKDNVASYEGK
jgi:inositol transport system substrate-binding protein